MSRRRAGAATNAKRSRSIHTHKSDLSQVLLKFSRSSRYGPRVFPQLELKRQFYNLKRDRDKTIGANWKKAFVEYVEEFIAQKFLQRREEGTLCITASLRAKFRVVRRQIREANVPQHRLQYETAYRLKQALGPGMTKTQAIRVHNEVVTQLNNQPRAAPLQAWPSVSTVDGNEHWAESQIQASQTQEQGDADVEMEVDQIQGQDRGPFAGPSRSPIRPPTITNPEQYYPSPESALRRPPNYISDHQRRDVPPSPTPTGRLSRPGSKILGQPDGEDADMGGEDDDEDRGEGPSGLQVRRNLFSQSAQAAADGAGHQCEHLRDLEDVRRQLEKKSHDEKAVRSEKESLSNLHVAVVVQRDAVTRERDAIQADRDAVVLEKKYVTQERDTLRTRNVVLEGENTRLTAENAQLEAEKAEWEREKVELQEQLTRLQDDLDELKREKVQWETQKEDNEREKQEMERRIQWLTSQLAAVEIEVARTEAEKEGLVQGRRADAEHITNLQRTLDQARADLDRLKVEFRELKDARDAIQRDLDQVRDLLGQRTAELEGVNVLLQAMTAELSHVQEAHQTLEAQLKEELENHQVTKQLLEQERRDLNAIIRAREEQLRVCRDELTNYGQLARLLNEQRQACANLISGLPA